MIRLRSAVPAALLGVLAAAAAFAAFGGPDRVPTYEARYEVEYKGRRVGESVQRVQPGGAPETYRFESITSPRGLARLLRRRPIVERSTFEAHAGTVRPLEFRLDDGTRKGDDSVAVEFDWSAATADVETSDADTELPIEPDVHDRATLQVALMMELAAGREPDRHLLIDDDSVKTYEYEIDGTETLDTPAGTLETLRVTQRRDGSSRRTIIWTAPDLRYLPVKIEQRRDEEALTTLTLTSVEGL